MKKKTCVNLAGMVCMLLLTSCGVVEHVERRIYAHDKNANDYLDEANEKDLQNSSYLYEIASEYQRKENYKKALEWYKKSADLASVGACQALAEAYNGRYIRRFVYK